jgi:hypothetical protein
VNWVVLLFSTVLLTSTYIWFRLNLLSCLWTLLRCLVKLDAVQMFCLQEKLPGSYTICHNLKFLACTDLLWLNTNFCNAIQSVQNGKLYCLLSACKESNISASLFDACSLCKGILVCRWKAVHFIASLYCNHLFQICPYF